jgi:hypothetical protein
LENVDERETILGLQRNKEPGHDGEMKGHVTFVPPAKIGGGILRPLVRLSQQHAVCKPAVDVPPKFLEKSVRLRKILTNCAFPFVQIRHGVEPPPVHAESVPKVDHPQDRLADTGVRVVEFGLVREKTVPVVRFGYGVPGPVGRLEVLKDDPGLLILFRRLAPHVELAPGASWLGELGPPEPRMLVGGVIEDELRNDP